MRLRNGGLAIDGGDHRGLQELCELEQGGTGSQRSAPGQNHRVGRVPEHVRSGRDGVVGSFLRSAQRASLQRGGVDIGGGLQQVQRDLDVDRARTPVGEEREGLVNQLHGLAATGDPGAAPDEGPDSAGGVLGFVQEPDVRKFAAAGRTRGQDDHGPGLAVRGGGGGHGVQQPGSGGGDHDAGQPLQLAPAVGAVPGPLLVAGGDRADAERLQMPVELKVVGTGDPEDRVDPVVPQGGHDGAADVVGGDGAGQG
ncbi:hypothetical protein QFZ69_000419 [Arthrobacter sp. V1I7]|nr:hypothetical protein [Arthrobacter sp. V1I7]